MRETLYVRIQSPDKIIWEGEAASISSENTEGVFDVLPHHANFISLLNENAPVIVRLPEKKSDPVEYSFGRTVIFVRNNFVSVYTF